MLGCRLEDKGFSDRVEWAADAAGAVSEDVGVDHCGADVAVAEELLDGADVVAALEEVGGEGVAEGVAGDPLVEARLACSTLDGTLHHALVKMMPALQAG
jgi:hypothetical protein